ncbi:signal recognition particle subunit srp68 [Nowakowskiella sp. JEL0078]|nr:signal recognition particle subunit srp68 [Nowakowskiella sp. JEL0078]
MADIKISLSILAVTNDSRNMYGIRHLDYQRYRQFCSRKIHRLRKRTGLIQNTKKKYEKKEIKKYFVKDDSALQILLFETERAWSFANQLKVESDAEPRKRHHLVSRLRKASKAAAELQALCLELGDSVETQTMLEVEAYSLNMDGFVLFEIQLWQQALDKFASASHRTIYTKLAGTASSAEFETLCHSAMDSIDPNIRYCAYNLKLKGGQSLDVGELIEMQRKAAEAGAGLNLLTAKVESLLNKTRHEKAQTVHSVTWRGQVVPTKNNKLVESIMATEQIVEVLEATVKTNAVENLFKISESGSIDFSVVSDQLQLFDKVLGAYWEATKIAEADLKENTIATAKVKSSKSDETTAHLNFVFAYITFNRLQKTMQRNLLLIEATKAKLTAGSTGSVSAKEGGIFTKKPKGEDIIRLYDGILQSLREAKDLTAVESDIVLQNILTARIFIMKAQRSQFIAQLATSNKKLKESLVLLNRTMEHLINARKEIESAELTFKTRNSKKSPKSNDSIVTSQLDFDEISSLKTELERLTNISRGIQIAQKAKQFVQDQNQFDEVQQGLADLDLSEKLVSLHF